jgi:MFS family permease
VRNGPAQAGTHGLFRSFAAARVRATSKLEGFHERSAGSDLCRAARIARPAGDADRILPPYLRKRPLVAFLLGISSGFPLTLLLSTMTFWLSKVGIDKATIGFAVGLTTPYTLKFLWAPLVDKLPLPFLTRAFGQRRGWLFFIQALLILAVWQLGTSNPQVGSMGTFAFWAIVVAFLSATQDIVIDAYRIEILSDEEMAHGTATNQFGYRTGNLIAGAGTIYIASSEGLGLGWGAAYGLTGLAIIPAIIGALWIGPGRYVDRYANASGMSAGQWLRETVWNPFREFLGRNGAFLILAFVLLYKVGDAMGQIMLSPMIVELGFADLDYVSANKAWGFAALIVGSALGAPFILWLGMGRALLFSGLLMMVLQRHVHDPGDGRQQLLDAGRRRRDGEPDQRHRADGVHHLSVRPVEPGLHGHAVRAAVVFCGGWADLAVDPRRASRRRIWAGSASGA